MRPFDGRRVLLGVTGGIASYKAAWLARLLAQAGAEVDVVMTRAATEFVGPVTFEALTGRQVHTELFDSGHAFDHIRLAREASAAIIAPATADFLARVAHGHADDLLSACMLATEAPVLLVPAMNDRMWSNVQTRRNVQHLRENGYLVLDPEDGMLAAGEGSGPGRMPEPDKILAHAGRLMENRDLSGTRLLVTAGPTREPVDPVRVLSNRSSGRMGVAIAAAAWRRGGEVTLVAGPLEVAAPAGVTVVSVETTDDMARAVREHLSSADVLVMAAAPADFRPASRREAKIKKKHAPAAIELAATEDILASTMNLRRPRAVIVGFALETEDMLLGAREKLDRKELDLVIANNAGEDGAGFSVETNRVAILGRHGALEELPLMLKSELADVILDRVSTLFRDA
ncbi:MAG: bifunctional phosphopantothenoylcysteine decarboxylase/phosphopantothenate--cysteine ligase CoaBC [Gemmatimonadaceae bacterium]